MKKYFNTRIGLSAVLTFVGAVIACLGSVWVPAAVVGGVLAAIGAVWSAIEQNASDREIKDQNIFIRNYITGSDSYCYIEPSRQSLEENSTDPDYAIIHIGEYPLYDASMIVTDLDEMKIRKHRGELSTKDIEQIPLGTIPPKQVLYNHGVLYLSRDADKRAYNIQFIARNGWWFQNLRFKRVNGKWYRATRVIRLVDQRKNEVLYCDVPSEFPRDNNGEIEW